MTLREYSLFKSGFIQAERDSRIFDILLQAKNKKEEEEDRIAEDYAEREMRGLRRMLKEMDRSDPSKYSFDLRAILQAQTY